MQIKPLLMLDMDGVLVDVGDSYREVIRNSVALYLREFIGADITSAEFIKPNDVARIKQSGGLSNDWELTYVIIDAILKRYFDNKNLDLFDSFIKLREESNDVKLLKEGKNLLIRAHRSFLESGIGKTPIAAIYYEEKEKKSSPFLMNRNDIGSGNLVKRIFQELYLGEKLFRKNHSLEPIFHNARGYIERERLIPSKGQLKKLSRLCALAIATGRPLAEADHALERFTIKKFFCVLVTEDDVERAQKRSDEVLRKPHPFMIKSCMERCGYKAGETTFYVGDMPDDIGAALRAGAVPIGFVDENSGVTSDEIRDHRKLISDKGAVKVFGNFEELVDFIQDKYG
ncbi:MAG: HAD hydrolase-like protein [Spirochaetota bacterium]|nr:MAG: HAD hydrolase-like protein [Spirochaetota bacterium]